MQSKRSTPPVVALVAAALCLAGSLAPASGISSHTIVAWSGDPDTFGTDISSAGDFNGDGYADIICSARTAGVSGEAYVLFGGPHHDDVPDVTMVGEGTSESFGRAVSSAGDFNHDGYDDVIVARSDMSTAGPGGRAYLYYGGPDPDGTPDLIFNGETPGDYFGECMAPAGDVNGDGRDDLIIGAREASGTYPNSGEAYVYFGSTVPDASPDLVLEGDPTAWFADSCGFGRDVAGAGDFNGDGYDDVIVSQWGSFSGINFGCCWVFLGGPGADGMPDGVLYPTDVMYEMDLYGQCIAGLGDVNGDGFDDVAVAARYAHNPNYDDGYHAGEVHVYFGNPATDAGADLILVGGYNDQLGWDLDALGDVNGDGYADFIVQSINAEEGDKNGISYLHLGGPELSETPALKIAPGRGSRHVARAGDVDGDGLDDLLALCSWGDYGDHDVLYALALEPLRLLAPAGGEAWLAGRPVDVRWRGGEAADVALSVDDGFTWDIIARNVGGNRESSLTIHTPATLTGQARMALFPAGSDPTDGAGDISPGVFRIIAADPPKPVAQELRAAPLGLDPGDKLGNAVASAGDFNADGYDDYLVGVIYAGGSGTGEAYLFFGGPGSDDVADLIFTGGAANEGFGCSVAKAGDYDGDGYADIVIGARGSDAAGPNRGRAYIYCGGPSADNVADFILDGATDNELLGGCVAPAGDVNGDTFDDLVIGAEYCDVMGTDAGGAYVFFGGPSADVTADMVLNGATDGDRFGGSVSSAGDINGDGFDDLVIGAARANPFEANQGRVYVYFGGSDPDEVADMVMTGEALGDFFGYSVSSIASLNGYDYPALIVGAPYCDADGSNSGRVYIYHGGPGADTVPDAVWDGESQLDTFGWSVAGLGDVNGDGLDDIVVGAHGDGESGRAYVFYGGRWGDGCADLVLTGAVAGEEFGTSVGAAGDVDGDGFRDILVGAPENDEAGTNAGAAYLYTFSRYRILSPAPDQTWITIETEEIVWLGAEPADIWLRVDGIGNDQLLLSGVGGRAENTIDLPVPDHPAPVASIVLTPTDPTVAGCAESGALRIASPKISPKVSHRELLDLTGEGDWEFGQEVAGIGDINADGWDDVLVADPLHSGDYDEEGRVYIYYGGPAADDIADETLWAPEPEGQFGSAVAGGQDINGDGWVDVMVGCPYAGPGYAQIYYGGPGPLGNHDLFLSGEVANDSFGGSMAMVGDVNGDGWGDFAIGAPYNDEAGATAGKVYIYFGGPAIDGIADLTLLGEAAGDRFGAALSGARDVDGDGRCDLLVGAYGSDAGGADAGRAYLFLAGSLASGTPNLTLTGETEGDQFGDAVAGVGDVDGDRYADLLIGAWRCDIGGTYAGRAYLYRGGPGMDGTPDLVIAGSEQSRLGRSISSAGDMNGDGWCDFSVGSPNLSTGEVRVYFGGPRIDETPDLLFSGESTGDAFAAGLACAGDMNGDGCSDIIIGAPGATNGRAIVYDAYRYRLRSPVGGELWSVGSQGSVSWIGGEPADVWLSVDGGATYELMAGNVGGSESNAVQLLIPHQPTRFARVKLTCAAPGVLGRAVSDSFFTIDASIVLLEFLAQPATDGPTGTTLSWNTDPGPDDLEGYRIERQDERGGTWTTLVPLTRETTYTDTGAPTSARYRLIAINGLGEEMQLGETAGASLAALSAWPRPYRSGEMQIAFQATGESERAVVKLYDAAGRLVRTVADGAYGAGLQLARWDGRDDSGQPVGGGIYFLRSATGGHQNTLRILVIR